MNEFNYSFGRSTKEEAEDHIFTLQANGKRILYITEDGRIVLNTDMVTSTYIPNTHRIKSENL